MLVNYSCLSFLLFSRQNWQKITAFREWTLTVVYELEMLFLRHQPRTMERKIHDGTNWSSGRAFCLFYHWILLSKEHSMPMLFFWYQFLLLDISQWFKQWITVITVFKRTQKNVSRYYHTSLKNHEEKFLPPPHRKPSRYVIILGRADY